MENQLKAKEISQCCKAEVFEEVTWPHVIERLKEEFGLQPYKDYPPFETVSFCRSCLKPCTVVQELK